MTDARAAAGIEEHGYPCREVVELATEYIEGALPPEAATLFEVHLNFCGGCSVFVEQLREAATLSHRVDESELPDSLRTELLRAFRDWKRT